MTNYEGTVHTVLSYLMTKCVIDGSSRKATVRVPYSQLVNSIGAKANPDYQDTDLVVTLNFIWDESLSNDITLDLSEAELNENDDFGEIK